MKSLVYDTPYTRANQCSVNLAVELYKTDLEVYCHRGLPRFTRSRSFHSRADSAYLYLVRQCPYLHTLVRPCYFESSDSVLAVVSESGGGRE